MVNYFAKLKRQTSALTKKNIYNIQYSKIAILCLLLSPSMIDTYLHDMIVVIHICYKRAMLGSDVAESSFSIDLNEFSQCITFDKFVFFY